MSDAPVLRRFRDVVAAGGYIGAGDPDAVAAFGEHGAMAAQSATTGPLGGSVDGAIAFKEALLPRWFWRCGHGSQEPGWAHLNRVHPDHCDRLDEANGKASTPAKALVLAVLNAALAMAEAGQCA
ncbi:hypothetical protein NVS89_22710 [Ancylobacter sp. MQZ15Z-1]|uniref:Uncharacterized protein n=1 Tax=Ancylobacter mangrovi TaxID=2972472 RepID=A0A9X2PFP0_9HYPH|nr:hypothetical protein [Ancylobacter mangrovi]MCS0497907.1 hypothetical protein [Ancylobacter mangrovi]